jgi:hypothetical protein
MKTNFFQTYENFKFSYYTKDRDIDNLIEELEMLLLSLEEPQNEIVNGLFKIVGNIRSQILSKTNYSNKGMIEIKLDEFEGILMNFFAIQTEHEYDLVQQDIKNLAKIYQNMFAKK